MPSMPAAASPRWPTMAVCLYAALIPFQPVVILPDGSPLRFAAADAIAPLVFLAALARPRRRVPFGLAALAAAIPLLALVSTLVGASGQPLSMYAIGKTAGLFYLVALCLAVVRATGAEDAPAVVRALARGAFWSAVIGLVGFAAWLAGIETSLMKYDRLCSTMTGDPNIYGSLLGVALLVTATDRAALPVTRVVHSVVLALALLATGSRSAFLGTIAAFAVCELVRSRDPFVAAARNGYLLAAAGLAAVALLASELGSAGATRLWEHHWRDFTVEGRLDLYARALEQFGEHPLTGLGIGGFRELNTFELAGSVSHFVVHNTYLWALVDLGIGGGLLVVGLLCGAMWRCVRAARGHPAAESAAVVAAGLGAMAVFNLFIDGFYQRHFWILMACAIGMPVYRPARQAAAAAWRRRPIRAMA